MGISVYFWDTHEHFCVFLGYLWMLMQVCGACKCISCLRLCVRTLVG